MAILGRQFATIDLFKDFYQGLMVRLIFQGKKKPDQLLSRMLRSANDEGKIVTQRYYQIKNNYFPQTQKALLGSFLQIKDWQQQSVESILQSVPKSRAKFEVVRVLRHFLHGRNDAVTTARQLDQLSCQTKPKPWHVIQSRRFMSLEKFIESFKLTCMRHVLIENRDKIAEQIIQKSSISAKPVDKQHQSLFCSHDETQTQHIVHEASIADYLKKHNGDTASGK